MQFKNTAILFAAIAANSVSVSALPTTASDVSFRGLRALDVNFLARSYEVERSPRAIRALSAAISLARRTDEDISSTTNATLPPLDYAYDALEPYISKEIMTLHHDKHHQAYITALNNAEAAYAKASTIQEQISLQQAIKFNGGGHINHSQFWKILAPSPEKGGSGGQIKDGEFKSAVEETFGGIDNLKKEFNTATAAIQGSGWGWVGVNIKTNRLEIISTANQDPLLTHIPIIGVDVWEHAFYLQYKNVKADYLTAIWNVINFDEAEKRYSEAVATKA